MLCEEKRLWVGIIFRYVHCFISGLIRRLEELL